MASTPAMPSTPSPARYAAKRSSADGPCAPPAPPAPPTHKITMETVRQWREQLGRRRRWKRRRRRRWRRRATEENERKTRKTVEHTSYEPDTPYSLIFHHFLPTLLPRKPPRERSNRPQRSDGYPHPDTSPPLPLFPHSPLSPYLLALKPHLIHRLRGNDRRW